MELTPDTTEEQTQPEETKEIDSFWLVANIFAIISLLEEKFGPQAVEQVVMVATAIENSMRAEAEKTE
jgi:ribosomal protein L7/L12